MWLSLQTIPPNDVPGLIDGFLLGTGQRDGGTKIPNQEVSDRIVEDVFQLRL